MKHVKSHVPMYGDLTTMSWIWNLTHTRGGDWWPVLTNRRFEHGSTLTIALRPGRGGGARGHVAGLPHAVQEPAVLDAEPAAVVSKSTRILIKIRDVHYRLSLYSV